MDDPGEQETWMGQETGLLSWYYFPRVVDCYYITKASSFSPSLQNINIIMDDF